MFSNHLDTTDRLGAHHININTHTHARFHFCEEDKFYPLIRYTNTGKKKTPKGKKTPKSNLSKERKTMSPTTLAHRHFTNRNSTIAGNIKSYKSTLRKTFKSVATSIAHALDDDDFYGGGGFNDDSDSPGGREVAREYPELDYRCYSRATSNVSAATWVLDNYQRELALPMGKLQVHRPPPTPARRRTVSVAGPEDSSNANANTNTHANGVSGLTVRGERVADEKEDRRSVMFAYPTVSKISGEKDTGKTQSVTVIMPSVGRKCKQSPNGTFDTTHAVRRPQRSPFPRASHSIQSETTDSTYSRTNTEKMRLSDRTSSLLSGSINYFSKSRLVASRSSSTVRQLQVRNVSPTIELTEKEEVAAAEAQPEVPQIFVTQASTRSGKVTQSDLKPDNLADSSAPSSSSPSPLVEVPQVLRPVKARLVNIPPRSRVTSLIEPCVKFGDKWRCEDTTVAAKQSGIVSSTAEQRANRRKGIVDYASYLRENDNSKERLSLYRPYNPQESSRMNLDNHNSTSLRSGSPTSSQVSAEQNRQLVGSLGISSKAYNRLLAALERGSFLSDSAETEAEDLSEAPASSNASVSATAKASSPVRVPTALRPQNSKSSSSSSSPVSLASNDSNSAALQARLAAMSGSTECYRAMMSAGHVARRRREKREWVR